MTIPLPFHGLPPVADLRAPCRLFLLGMLLGFAPFLHAQDASPGHQAEPSVVTKVDPAAVNGFKTIFPVPSQTHPLKVAIYEGKGSPESGIKNVSDRLLQIPGTTIDRLSAEAIGKNDLSSYDLVVFSGGLSNTQAKYIGDDGKANIRKYVSGGGNYMGICAGAYLACAGYKWSIGLLNAETVTSNWFRGRAYLNLELSPEGRKAIGDVEGTFKCRYNSGPVIRKLNRQDLPDYTVLAWFREEKAAKPNQVGTMVNTPAIVMASYGKGRVLALSPHSENTAGLENLIPRAVLTLVSR